jgi:DNA-binding Xre family transcriptional regulator
MPLDQAMKTVMRERGLKMPDLLTRMLQRDRSTVYRLFNGDTRDAKLSTLLDLCAALDVTPNDFLSLAGLWNDEGHTADSLDARLRKVFTIVQALAAPYKLVAVTQVERLVGTWQEAADGVLGREPEN